MAIYLTKQTSIDGTLQPVGKRLDGVFAEGTVRSLIRAGRAVVRPARGDEPEPSAPETDDEEDPEEDVPEVVEDPEEDDEDVIDAEFEVEPVDEDATPTEAPADDEPGGVSMDDLAQGVPAGDAETPDPETVSIHSIGLSRALSDRLDDLGIKTKADALRHAESNGGRFGDELPRIGDVYAQRINAALGL